MVRGAPADRERAVARAVELGINYLDTAPSYGSGQSERNTGAVLRALRPDVIVGSKCRLSPADLADVPGALTRAVETSLEPARAFLASISFTSTIRWRGSGASGASAVADVLDAVVPAARRLQEQGKIRFFGVTALGETGALHRVSRAAPSTPLRSASTC